MRELSALVTMLLAMCVLVLFINWAVRDAKRRRKHPLFVVIAVVFFFPLGWLAWILFRPAVDRAQLNAHRNSDVNPVRS